ncbi:MAG: energy-coupling factor transporter transmembrane component T [Bacillota bacterium]|nr:energy-coupling factor transporter transmembrane component T [Bacillota bacterium]
MKFDSYHPVINFIYFTAAIAFTIAFHHPVFLAISYAAAFAYSVKLGGVKALIFNLCLVPFMVIYALWYSYYNHFGVTVLGQNFAGNDMTLESLVFGVVISVTAAAVIMWMSCVFRVISSDKVVYLFGRISPKLSLFLSILLRSVPRIKETARRVSIAQRGIGRKGPLRILSIMMTWTLESFASSSESMKSRGYSLRGRTAFSIYRFDNRDRSFVVMIFLCLTLILMAIMFDQTNIHYDPEIIMNRVTPVSYIFYAAYAALLLLPMGLQIAGELRFKSNLGKGEQWTETFEAE